jgi:hypothetical protein
MHVTWKQNILMAVMNRYFIVMINFILISIIISIIFELVSLIKTPENDTKEMVEMCNGIAIIMYGYGVAMELRRDLIKYLHLLPLFATQLQEKISALCHKYGIYFILLALGLEILVHVIIIPNRVINTEGKESYIFAICFFILLLLSILLIRLSVILVRVAYIMRIREEGSNGPKDY